VAAVVLTAMPVFGAPLSGAELLELFDKTYAPVLYDAQEQLDGVVAAAQGGYEQGEQQELYGGAVIVVIIPEEGEYYTERGSDITVIFGGGSQEQQEQEDEDEDELPPLPPVEGFAVTSGINVRSESTFDSSRTIVGTAPRGAVIRIDVFGYNVYTESFYQQSGSVLIVGASGNFSSAQQLAVGRNFIRVKAVYIPWSEHICDYECENAQDCEEGDTSAYVSVETAQLNRLPNEVRSQLERGLLTP
jgi:hypothetical protein